MIWQKVPWYKRLWRRLFPPKDIIIFPKCRRVFPRYVMDAPAQIHPLDRPDNDLFQLDCRDIR